MRAGGGWGGDLQVKLVSPCLHGNTGSRAVGDTFTDVNGKKMGRPVGGLGRQETKHPLLSDA